MSVNIMSLIEAKMNGQSFSKILHAVRSGRETVSSLPEDQLDFLESMLKEVKEAVPQLEAAIKNDDLDTIKEVAVSFRDIFQMIEESCNSQGENNVTSTRNDSRAAHRPLP